MISSTYSINPTDPTRFDPSRIEPIRHTYQSHPLLQLDALAELARRLMPHGNCRFIRPGTKLDSPFDHEPKPDDGRSLEEVLEQIEEPGGWLAIYDAQHDAIYRDLLAEVQGGMQQLVEPKERIFDVRAFFFISAPPSVTPFHIDRENNFWLQLRGRKRLTLWDHRDRDVVAAKDVEDFLLGKGLMNVKLTEASRSRGREFNCGPGDGVYFPSTTPHMTEARPEWMDGDTLSISVGMVFYTNITRRHARVRMLNQQLRAIGVEGEEPGQHPLRDRAKAILGRSLWEVQKRVMRR